MKSHNLAKLSKEQQAEMRLEMRAALLIHNQRRGKISGDKIREMIDYEFDEVKKERLRFFLNKFHNLAKNPRGNK